MIVIKGIGNDKVKIVPIKPSQMYAMHDGFLDEPFYDYVNDYENKKQ